MGPTDIYTFEHIPQSFYVEILTRSEGIWMGASWWSGSIMRLPSGVEEVPESCHSFTF